MPFGVIWCPWHLIRLLFEVKVRGYRWLILTIGQ